MLPPNLKLRKAESDLLSNSSYSSRSSIPSINDNASVSSLDLSFDGAGNPTFKNTKKTSAFAKVRGGTENYDSVSEDDSQNDEPSKPKSNNASPVRMSGKKKSSFFRLKDNEGSDED